MAAALLAPSFVSAETIQSKICTPFNGPAITAPASSTTTSNSAITVAGSGEVGSEVSIYNNRSGVGATTVAPGGSFAVQVPLNVGNNQLTARIANSCNTVKESQDINVVRSAPATSGSSEDPGSNAGSEQNTTASSPNSLAAPKVPVITDLNAVTPSTSQVMSPQVNVPLTARQIKAQEQIITQPKADQTVSNDRLLVAGTAAPFSTVDVYINELIVARVVAAADGTYRTIVGIRSGGNSVHVQATDSDGVVTTRTINVKLDRSMQPAAPSAAKPDSTDQTVFIAVLSTIAIGGFTLVSIIGWHTHTLRMRTRKINHV